MAGPFAAPPFHSFCVSPLGLVPKKTPGDFRLIHHLSFPKGASVNDGIFAENTSVRYATVSDAIRLIKRVGQGCYLAKTDIKTLFVSWRGLYYYHRCMLMGCACSIQFINLI